MTETGTSPSAATPQLDLRRITKAFPSTIANDQVDLAIGRGEVHALLGENGAGKSTLVKMIYGVMQPDDGDIIWQGEKVTMTNPAFARKLGIGMVFQHFSLFDSMTVLENVALGIDERLPMKELAEKITDISERYGLPLDPARHIHHLSVGERQRVEIVRCLLQNPQLLIMDEPTSVLNPQEVEKLFVTLRRLASEGVSILYISHKLDEIKELCTKATILRGGKVVGACDPREKTAHDLAQMMIGEELVLPERTSASAAGEDRLVVNSLSLSSNDQFAADLQDVSLSVRSGEIVGVAGVAGNGQNTLLSALSGERLTASADAIHIDGRAVGKLGPRARRELGLAFVPEERLGHGAVPELSLADNTVLSGHKASGLVTKGVVSFTKAHDLADKIIAAFNVKAGGSASEARSLSGGNLQKFIIGRELLKDPGLIVVANPTWGVDAGAASAIHQALIDLRDKGAAVLVVSQDLDELFAISDRMAVICQGRLSRTHDAHSISVERVGMLMGGLFDLQDEWEVEDHGAQA